MTLTIGRVTITQNPSQLELNGDRLDVGGWFFGTDLNHAKVIREQLIGLDGNEDEPDVPVTWSYDAKVDGYYTVKSVAVSHIMGVAYEDFKFEYAMQLERIEGGFAAPLCEVAASIALRSNAHSITVSAGRIGLPVAATAQRGMYATGVILAKGASPRVTATGNVDQYTARAADSSFGSYTFNILPADFYDAATLIEQSVGGVWYPVVGDQIGSVVGNLFRVGNGLVRMTYHTDGIMSMEVWDGSVWESATSFELVGSISGKWLPVGGWRVLKNAADACTVQTAVNPTTDIVVYRTVTLHIERSRVMFEIAADGLYWPTVGGSFNEALELQATVGVAATAVTGGIIRTANDANGHRWVMYSPSAVTKDVAAGSLTIAAPGAPLVAQFGLGFELGGTGGAAQYDETVMNAEYFAALGTRQRVVAR